jgi:hypothetical protein
LNILLTDSIHLIKDKNENYYTPSIYNKEFLGRYISIFGKISIAAKTNEIISKEIDFKKYIKIDTSNVDIIELPWSKGFIGILKNIIPIFIIFRKYRKKFDGYIFRLAQAESYLAYFFIRKKKKSLPC